MAWTTAFDRCPLPQLLDEHREAIDFIRQESKGADVLFGEAACVHDELVWKIHQSNVAELGGSDASLDDVALLRYALSFGKNFEKAVEAARKEHRDLVEAARERKPPPGLTTAEISTLQTLLLTSFQGASIFGSVAVSAENFAQEKSNSLGKLVERTSMLVSALLFGCRWMQRSGRKLHVSTQVASPGRIKPQVAATAFKLHVSTSPQVAATVSQTLFFLPAAALQSIVPLLVAQNFKLSAELWGAVCAAEGLAKIIGAVPVAALLSSWGRKPVLVLSFICFAVSMLALAHTGTILGLLGAKLLLGASILAQSSGMQLFLTDISTSENRSRVMAPVLMAEKLSSMLGPLIGGVLVQTFGATMATTQLAGVSFVAASLNQGMLKETKPEKPVLNKNTEEAPSKKFLQLFRNVRVREAVIFSAAYWGILSSTLYCLVPLMLTQVFSLGALAFSVVLAATNLLCFLCARPAAAWSDRWGRKAVLVPGMVLVGMGTLLLAFVPHIATSQSTEILALTLLLGALAIGQGLVGPALPTIFTDSVAPSLHVESLSLLRIFTEVGAVILSLTMCHLVESSGFGFPLVTAGVAALLAAARFSMKY